MRTSKLIPLLTAAGLVLSACGSDSEVNSIFGAGGGVNVPADTGGNPGATSPWAAKGGSTGVVTGTGPVAAGGKTGRVPTLGGAGPVSTQGPFTTGGKTGATTGVAGGPSGGATGGPTTVKKFVGNITTGYSGAADAAGLSYAKYWDQITPENSGKWGSAQPTAGGNYSWGALDTAYDYAMKNNIIFKQHCFVWGNQQPSNDGSITEAQVKAWMKAFCERYPKTALIDVVNEPPPHTTPKYANAIGGGTNGDWKWIANAFKWAREACPNAVLILNDYNDIEYQNETDHIVDIVKKIKAAGAPIDAVGAQSHDLDLLGISKVSTVKGLIERLHTGTGLPVYITEYDISTTDDAAQLALYKEYFPFFLSTEYIHGVTIWGWIFGQTWDLAKDSGLVKDGKSRPAMTWLMEQLGRTAP